MSCSMNEGKVCNYCDECVSDDTVYCKSCKSYKKHDRNFGYCRLEGEQKKADETCNMAVPRFKRFKT